MNHDSDPTSTAGADTLMGVLDEAGRAGYDVQQLARPNARVECSACGQQTPARDFDIDHVRRLEGASDSADLLLVTWSACPSCGRRGTLVLGYGPNANADDTAIALELDLDGADHSIGTASTGTAPPGDTAADIERQQAGGSGKYNGAEHVDVLVGVDETAESRSAVEAAWKLFGARGSYTIVCVHERQPLIVPGLGSGATLGGIYAHLDQSIGEQLANEAATNARTAVPKDADVDLHTDVGHAGSTIIDAAVEHRSDLIVIGSHDRSFWQRVFSPSVGKYLVENAPCPVLVVRSAPD